MEVLRSEPWLTESANAFLDYYFKTKTNVKVLEYGSGASTLWFLKQKNTILLHSYEFDTKWYDVVFDNIIITDIGEVDLTYYLCSSTGEIVNYHRICPDYTKSNDKYCVILVDGGDRIQCVQKSIDKLESGGILIFDNSEREEYLPGVELLKDWPKIETYQLVPDKYGYTYPGWKTTIFFKP
ncbi:MAG: hypothetical protein PHX80_04515 [Candidatus Nanoarchaeia archaeon]|nr:hypothetical protein [Candidatus Nanoarchaeia archaeon]